MTTIDDDNNSDNKDDDNDNDDDDNDDDDNDNDDDDNNNDDNNNWKIECIDMIVRLVSITPGHVKLDWLPPSSSRRK